MTASDVQDESEPDTTYNGLLAKHMLGTLDDATKWELAKGLQAAGQLQIPVDLTNFIGVVDPVHELVKETPAALQHALLDSSRNDDALDEVSVGATGALQALPPSMQQSPSAETVLQEFYDLINSSKEAFPHSDQASQMAAPLLPEHAETMQESQPQSSEPASATAPSIQSHATPYNRGHGFVVSDHTAPIFPGFQSNTTVAAGVLPYPTGSTNESMEYAAAVAGGFAPMPADAANVMPHPAVANRGQLNDFMEPPLAMANGFLPTINTSVMPYPAVPSRGQTSESMDPGAAMLNGFPLSSVGASTAPYLAVPNPPAFPPGPIQLRLDGMGLQDAPSSASHRAQLPIPPPPPPGATAATSSETEGNTTVVLQQIGTFNKSDLIIHIEQFGFPQGLSFDFLYYPSNFDRAGANKSKAHHGYAIINFVNPEIAHRFMEIHGTESGKSRRGGDFSARWANVQGFEANASRYIKRHDRIRDPGLRPMMWINGSREGMTLTRDNLPPHVLERLTSRINSEKARVQERLRVTREQVDGESDEASRGRQEIPATEPLSEKGSEKPEIGISSMTGDFQ